MKKKETTITLPNGYNGGEVDCFTFPVEADDVCVKLRVATLGKQYMFRWVYKEDLQVPGKQPDDPPQTQNCFTCAFRRSLWASTRGPTAWCNLKHCAMGAEIHCEYHKVEG